MTDQPVTMWRCAWVDGKTDHAKDFDNEAAAERHATWLGRELPFRKAMKAYVYAVKIYIEEAG